ncbi:MAG: ISAs1 family transposase [Planctomycetaceae bacterium]|nr:ISAs1 family transposase [Planctomycetaceae bacterium]
MSSLASIADHFSEVTDPRRGEPVYPLHNILFISICAVICGADDFVAIAKFGRTKKDWFAKYLDLSEGIPSHDRFNAILALVRPDEFEKCLLQWVTALQDITDGQIVAIDGKTLRRSYDKASSKSAIHMVSAWATTNHISLGQVVVDAKSNEITAIPKLLELIEVSGALVTIDAMGCQTEIAAKIVDAEADYCLAAKGNQPTLYNGLIEFFDDHLEDDFARHPVRRFETNEKAHGREDLRSYFICPLPESLPDAERWKNLKAIGIAINNTMRNGVMTVAIRYYILSRFLSGKRFGEAVRGHWGVENNLHWQLDVSFSEDQCRIRKGHADTNFSTLRRTALSLLKREGTAKVGIKNKRLTAGWDEAYLEKVLFSK